MVAIEGFHIGPDAAVLGDLEDVEVGPGTLDDVAIPGVILDLSGLSLNDGVADVIYDGTDVVIQDSIALVVDEIKLGEVTITSDVGTLHSFNGRGEQIEAAV